MATVELVQHDDESGKTHLAAYSISDGMVHVTYLGAFPTTSTQIGGSQPDSLARLILKEFAAGKHKG